MAGLIEAIEIKRKSYFEFRGGALPLPRRRCQNQTLVAGRRWCGYRCGTCSRAVLDRAFKASEKFREPDPEMIPARGSRSLQQRARYVGRAGKRSVGPDRVGAEDDPAGSRRE